jgi:hypothetical protein
MNIGIRMRSYQVPFSSRNAGHYSIKNYEEGGKVEVNSRPTSQPYLVKGRRRNGPSR